VSGGRVASDRYAGVAIALLVAAGAGAALRLAEHSRSETCADPEALVALGDFDLPVRSLHSDFRVVQHRVDGLLDAERPDEPLLPFTIRRTFTITNWLMRPTFALPGPREPNSTEVHHLEIDGDPVDVAFAYTRHRDRDRLTAYTFAFDGNATLHPLWRRMADSPAALLRGVRPVTYIGVAINAHPSEIEGQKARVLTFMEHAWRHYREACRP